MHFGGELRQRAVRSDVGADVAHRRDRFLELMNDRGFGTDTGAACGELESTKSVSDVYAPVSGEVVARNEALDATPELVNSDPYGDGWLFEIVPADDGELDQLLDAAAYDAQVAG